MKCLIFSDSHGKAEYMRRAMAKHPDAEAVFFLGDGLSDLELLAMGKNNIAFFAVRGNCDISPIALGREIEKLDYVWLMNKKIVFTHGDLYSAKSTAVILKLLAQEKEVDILLFGHTHTPFLSYINPRDGCARETKAESCEQQNLPKPFYLFNPGSIGSYPASYGILTLTEGEPLFSHGRL